MVMGQRCELQTRPWGSVRGVKGGEKIPEAASVPPRSPRGLGKGLRAPGEVQGSFHKIGFDAPLLFILLLSPSG